MWRKILQIVGVVVAMAFIVAYICYAAYFAREYRSQQRVGEVLIIMEDVAPKCRLASANDLYAQLQNNDVEIINELIDSVDVAAILKILGDNGYVQDVDVCVTLSGKTCIDVVQYTPAIRMLSGGLNSYVTSDGTIFRVPQGAACHVPVVTGSYKPLFPPSYDGSVTAFYAMLTEKENQNLDELYKELDSLKLVRRSYEKKRAGLEDDKKRKLFESSKTNEQRRKGINVEIAKCDERLFDLQGEELKLKAREEEVELRKKKLQNYCDDFMNLINFVSRVRNDEFWGAEVVQFVTSTIRSGEISLQLIPRSGDFIIEFGTLADSEAKLARLKTFYDKGLSRIGWGVYKSIDVRYDKQVICKK